MKWIPLDDTREVHYHKDGFLMIRPKGNQQVTVPFRCPVCKEFMRDRADGRAFRDYECCSRCQTRWVDGDRDAWLQGGRPADHVIAEELKRRNG